MSGCEQFVRFIIEKSALIKPQDLDCSIVQELQRKKITI